MVNYRLSWILFFHAKTFAGLVLRVGCSFWLDPTLSISPKPRFPKVLSRKHMCHAWDLGTGCPCEVVSLNFHALNG